MHRFRPALLALALLAPTLAVAQSYPLNVGGTNVDLAQGTFYDNQGNAYLVGEFRGTADFDPTAGTSSLSSVGGTPDAFVASYDPGGALRWAFAIGGTGLDRANDVQYQTGRLFVTGYVSAGADFDPTAGSYVPPNGGGLDAFVAAYDVTGATPVLDWVAPISGPGDQIGEDLDIHEFPPFEVWVTGTLRGGADFDPGPGTVPGISAGLSDVFVAGYSAVSPSAPVGTLYDAFRIGNTNVDDGYGLSLYRPRVPCITGRYRGIVDFDPSGAVFNMNSAFEDGFVACYNATTAGSTTLFAPFNAFRITGPGIQRGYDIEANDAGVYVTGGFANTTSFHGASFPSNGGLDAFVAAYDIGAVWQWTVPFGGTGNDTGLGIHTDDCGNVFATGAFRNGPVDFDPLGSGYTLPTFAGYDAWVASYGPGGTFRFAERVARNGQDAGYGVAVKPSGAYLAAGQFMQTPVFSSGSTPSAAIPIASNGDRDGYLAAYGINGVLSSASCVAPPPGLQVWTDYDAFTGNYLDLSAPATPSNDGIPVGTVLAGPGVVDLGGQFPGLNDHLRINPDASLVLDIDDLTVDAYIQIDPSFLSDYFTIATTYNPGMNSGYEVQLRRATNTDWVIHVTLADGTNTVELQSTAFTIPVSTWMFVAATVDLPGLAAATFYVDGLPIGAAAATTALGPILSSGPMFEHRSAVFGGGDQPGWLDEVEVFHRLLSANQIFSIYTYGKCKPCWTAPYQPALTAGDPDTRTAPRTTALTEAPAEFALAQSTPNPTSGLTEIAFSLPATTVVRLVVYDVLGREVAVLVDEAREAGHYRVAFEASALPSGVYLYRLDAGAQTATRRMTVTR